jgi:hypothetical protein
VASYFKSAWGVRVEQFKFIDFDGYVSSDYIKKNDVVNLLGNLADFRATKNPYLGIYVFKSFVRLGLLYPPADVIEWVTEIFNQYLIKQGSDTLDHAFGLAPKKGRGKTKPAYSFMLNGRNGFIQWNMLVLVKVFKIPIKTAKGMVWELVNTSNDLYTPHWSKLGTISEAAVAQIYNAWPDKNENNLLDWHEGIVKDPLKATDYLRQYLPEKIPESIKKKYNL